MDTHQSPEITELAKALIAVQKTLMPAMKDANNPFTKSTYATLNSVMGSCREALLAHDIWMTQLPMPAPDFIGTGHIALLTKLTHAPSGQWQSSLTVAPLPKHDPQGMGSALTYCRRYALTAMLGMVTEDDDGEGAKMPTKTNKRTRIQYDVSGQKVQKTSQNTASNPTHYGLPHIDGILYQEISATDGRMCIVATGNTQAKKSLLKGAGFQWNLQRKMWWKYAESV